MLKWVVTALKESHADTKKYHAERAMALQAKYAKLSHRLDAMYDDKLDGRIDQIFFDQKSSTWKKEQDDILRKLERHQNANRSYVDEGVRLLELAQRAVILYDKQTAQEKRRIINFVCPNSVWKDGRLIANYRQLFDLLTDKNLVCKK